MIGRRFVYCILVKALDLFCSEKIKSVAEKALKIFFLGVLVSTNDSIVPQVVLTLSHYQEITFLICNIEIFKNYNVVYIFYLIYP